jgi:hypothetical protein
VVYHNSVHLELLCQGHHKSLHGLVSPHPISIALELEAASLHCQRIMGKFALEVASKLLVADTGGGTSNIVVQEVVNMDKASTR